MEARRHGPGSYSDARLAAYGSSGLEEREQEQELAWRVARHVCARGQGIQLECEAHAGGGRVVVGWWVQGLVPRVVWPWGRLGWCRLG